MKKDIKFHSHGQQLSGYLHRAKGKEKELITFTGIIAALGALFLNITLPQNATAKTSLVDLQVFWLLLLVGCLSLLFISCVKSVFEKEKELHTEYGDLQIRGVFSMLVGYVFAWIILSLLQYIFSFQPEYSSGFLGMILSFVGVALFLWLLIAIEKHWNKIWLIFKMLIISVLMTVSLIFVIASIQQLIFKSFFVFWLWPAPLIVFLIIFIPLMLLSVYRKDRFLSKE